MKYLLQKQMVRWWVVAMLVSLLSATSLSVANTPVFAANPTCSPSTTLDASSGSASCDMSISAQINPGSFTLANDAAASVPGSPFTLTGAAINASFSFTNYVRDHRGSSNGWSVFASTAGLTGPSGTTISPSFISLDTTASSCTNGTCPTVSFTPITLSGTPQKFLGAGNAAHTLVVDGDYTNKVNGQFVIPAGTGAGTYSGTITITLTNTF